MVKKAMNGWRPKQSGCESTVVPNEICFLSMILRADLSRVTFRKDVSPLFAALMEENGGSLTDGTTKKVRIASTGNPVAGVTRRRLNVCLMSAREARNSEGRGEC